MVVNRQLQSSPRVNEDDDSARSGFPPRLPTKVPKPPTTSTGLIKVEKNLASFGFFTPSNKKIRGTMKKTVVFSRNLDGKRVEVRAVILPSAAYGLPITSDQDKYFAGRKMWVSDTFGGLERSGTRLDSLPLNY